MNIARLAVILLFSASLAQAVDYKPYLNVWDINLGGDLLDVRDVDSDGKPDIIIGLIRDQGSYAYLLNNDGVLQWRNKVSVIWPNNQVNTLMVDDIDSSGNTSLVVGSVIAAKSCAGQLSPYENPLFVLTRDLSVENNMLKWVNRGYGYSISMYLSDLDSDGKKEILSGTREGILHVINPDGTQRWTYSTEGSINAVYTTDLNKDAVPDILLGTYHGVEVLNNLGNKLWSYKTAGQVIAVHAADLNGDGLKEVMGVDDRGRLEVFSTVGLPIWEYNLTAIQDSVAAADFDSDGKAEAIVAAGQTIYALGMDGEVKWDFDVDYPVVKVAAAPLTENGGPDLLVLGARKLTAYRMNTDYLNDQKAYALMSKAKKSYGNRSFESARDYALSALAIYSQLNDTDNQGKAQDINQSSNNQMVAMSLYQMALENYSAGDYQTSKQLAAEAERLYIMVKDPDRTDLALVLVNKAIDQIDSQYFLDRSLEYFHAEKYLDGSVYARKAYDTFEALNDTVRIQIALKILNNTEEYPKANKNYQEAMKMYERGNYPGALNLTDLAIVSYQILGDQGRLNASQTLKAGIIDKLRLQAQLQKAKEHLEQAQRQLNESNYHPCLEEAQSAMSLTSNITDDTILQKAQALNKTCGIGVQALKYYAKANEYFSQSQPEPAKDYASRARQLYRIIDDTEGAVKASDLILEIENDQEQKQKLPTAVVEQPALTVSPQMLAVAVGVVILVGVVVILWVRKLTKQKAAQAMDYSALAESGAEPSVPGAETAGRQPDAGAQADGTNIAMPEATAQGEPILEPSSGPSIGDRLEELLTLTSGKTSADSGPKDKKPPSASEVAKASSNEMDLLELKVGEEKAKSPAQKPNMDMTPSEPAKQTATPIADTKNQEHVLAKGDIPTPDEVTMAEKIKKQLSEINKKILKENR
jgi:tetratricopeptide (TPR) repeat protein